MPKHLDLADPRYKEAAAHVLRRHEAGMTDEHETNITSAVRDFIIITGLATRDEIVEEYPPAPGSLNAVDLKVRNTFIEVKSRIGTTGGGAPDPRHVAQLDGYLDESQNAGGSIRIGVLTDGKHWLLREPGADKDRFATTAPHAFTLENAADWLNLHDWLRDQALNVPDTRRLNRESIERNFGPQNPDYEREIDAIRRLYRAAASRETVAVKRRLWRNLLLAALGEIASSPAQLDELFVRHTYLSMTIGMVVQASFGLDIARLAEDEPADLLHGHQFHNKTGLHGIVESDFFAWPTEVDGGLPLIQTLARRINQFDWRDAPPDCAAILYETVIPTDERRQLGEYYTPAWLARVMVQELIEQPLEQRVLDPACGSGTFVVEAVAHFLAAAKREERDPKDTLEGLLDAVTGVDVHPVAVHLARAAWVLAAQPAIQAARDAGYDGEIAVPVYLGDALQLGLRVGELFADRAVPINVHDEQGTILFFPRRLVEKANDFDALMSKIAGDIERGDDPKWDLTDDLFEDSGEREMLTETIKQMRRLHEEGSDHIWAYYTRNLVRPVALEHRKVDVVIGNPPWLNYNKTANTLRRELEEQSKNDYDIWTGGRYASNQDVAGLFFTRSAHLYLKGEGVIGMVLPHSALQTGQYAKWRSGAWHAAGSGGALTVDFGYKPAWDLEKLEPNTFFPIAAAVVFARRTGGESRVGKAVPLTGQVERWLGKTDTADVRRVSATITDTSVSGDSHYNGHTREGASIYPRCLFFVEETENPAIIQAGQTITVNPRRGGQDKRPWRDLDLTAITGQTIETRHVYDVYLGETVVPYATLDPLKAVLPLRRGDASLPTEDGGIGGVSLAGLERRMRERWRTISGLWEQYKARANKLTLLGQIDYLHKLLSQLEWQRNPDGRPFRVIYSGSGVPTAALLHETSALVDKTLYWIACRDDHEAAYLLALINSDALYEAVTPLMAKGQFGARHLLKHLWKLPIPEYDGTEALHGEIAEAGEAAAAGAARELARLRRERERVTVTIARRELRKWLRESAEGARVEAAVGRLLG